MVVHIGALDAQKAKARRKARQEEGGNFARFAQGLFRRTERSATGQCAIGNAGLQL